MEVSTSNVSTPISFKTSDGKIIEVADHFKKFSLMLSDLLQLDIERTVPIELTEVHSTVLEEINALLENFANEDGLKGQIPYGKFDDETWNEYTVSF